jgi:hypothetical protein
MWANVESFNVTTYCIYWVIDRSVNRSIDRWIVWFKAAGAEWPCNVTVFLVNIITTVLKIFRECLWELITTVLQYLYLRRQFLYSYTYMYIYQLRWQQVFPARVPELVERLLLTWQRRGLCRHSVHCAESHSITVRSLMLHTNFYDIFICITNDPFGDRIYQLDINNHVLAF